MGRQAMVGALRRLVFDLLWAPPVKKVLQRVPRVRRIYNGWRRQHPFDLTLGVDTSGANEANALGVDPDLAAHSSPYGGSQPSILRRCLAALPDPAQYVFVDLGCGKGRPLLVASEFPFERVVGVEMAPHLAEIARRNAAIVSRGGVQQAPIEVEVGDATTAEAPAVRVVYFLYNPFDAVLIERVLKTSLPNWASACGTRLSSTTTRFTPRYSTGRRTSCAGRHSVCRTRLTSSVMALISMTRCWSGRPFPPGTCRNRTPSGT
ncbi:MAG: class I SAM-dependent methyltransferase [Acidobacteria bacterium]|nr:class I SAM-dependent methyltransferase [Acidobacteriota bacterium]